MSARSVTPEVLGLDDSRAVTWRVMRAVLMTLGVAWVFLAVTIVRADAVPSDCMSDDVWCIVPWDWIVVGESIVLAVGLLIVVAGIRWASSR